MTQDELKALDGIAAAVPTISADDGGDRTLLYGYDVDRRTHHLYQVDGILHLVVYTDSQSGGDLVRYETGRELPLEGVAPNKRLYPEACDFAFCRRLRQAGAHLPFTTYDPSRADKPFHGLLIGEIPQASMAPGPR